MEAVQDRWTIRRQATIEEILKAAPILMARDGVAGMSLSAMARAVGMKPPSLYEYFQSKMALYDALFAQGAADLATAVNAAGHHARHGGDPLAPLFAGARACVVWSLANPLSAQLLNWRPIPGVQAPAQAYAPSVAMVEQMRALLVLPLRALRMAR